MSGRYKSHERFTLRTKIWALLGFLLFALLAAAASAWMTLLHLERTAERMANKYAPQVERARDLEVLMIRISLEARHAILARTEAERDATFARIGEYRRKMEETLAEIERHITTERGREILKQIHETDAVFWRMAQEVVGKIKEGRQQEAFAQLADELVPARDRVVQAIIEQRRWQETLMRNAIVSVNQTADKARAVIAAFVALALALSAFVAWRLMYMLRGAFARARRVTSGIAGGDLALDVWVRKGDEFGDLFGSIVDMQQRLRTIVERARETSQRVVASAAALDQVNQEMGSATEEQMAAIEQASRQASRMADDVQASAESATNINQLAQKAATIAAQGGQTVADAVGQMDKINESSQRISEIVSVIDGIAFQTNILALNAAVEAARAGEAGRGFAVVAGEVRALAQRSSEAARQIRGLIEDTVQRVRSGASSAESARGAIGEVVQAVDLLSKEMEALAELSARQRDSTQQMRDAMASLSASAQQSTDVVQRSRATAEQMRRDAEELEGVVAEFKLGEEGPSKSSTLSPHGGRGSDVRSAQPSLPA
jgi:methyl-accepting chemotaxis protein